MQNNIPKIVVLDGNAVNPGDISWAPISSKGDFTLYPRSTQAQAIERARDADIVINNKVKLDEHVLSQLPNLKYIGLLSTGYDVVDIEYAKSKGIVVCNVPAYSSRSVAQLTIALLLELVMNVGGHSQSVHQGDWSKCPDFCYWLGDIIELDGKTIGLVGYGSIARYVAVIARSLGMRVLAYNRSGVVDENAEFSPLDRLLAESDIVSLHCPLNNDSRQMIDSTALSKMKVGSYLINTARGGLVVEKDVVDALDSGKLAGYASDVLAQEPPQADNLLAGHPKAVITPHIAWASVSARERLLAVASQNIKSFLAGSPINQVNK